MNTNSHQLLQNGEPTMKMQETYVCMHCEHVITTGAVCLPCNELDGALTIDEYFEMIEVEAAAMSLAELVAAYLKAHQQEVAESYSQPRAHVDEYDLIVDRACLLGGLLRGRVLDVPAARVIGRDVFVACALCDQTVTASEAGFVYAHKAPDARWAAHLWPACDGSNKWIVGAS